MKNKITILYICTMLVISTLYAIQPIQPLFQKEFSLTNFQAVIFTTVIMFPLGIAPIVYGYILERVSLRIMLFFSLFFLGILEIVFALSTNYAAMLFIRGAQGLLVPAALTSLVSYISMSSTADRIQQNIGNYVAVTILGGFITRLLSGYGSEYFGWQAFFVFLGILLIIFAFIILKKIQDIKIDFSKPNISDILKVLKEKRNLTIYLTMFCVYFIFQAVSNFLPFELKSISSDMGEGKIGFVYVGYVVGVIISVNATKIVRYFVNENNAMIVGVLIYIAGIGLLNIPSFYAMLVAMIVFCSGMFTIHSIANGYINRMAKERKSIANGLYLSFYYLGGTLGTFLPTFIYTPFGWAGFLQFMLFVILIAISLLVSLKISTQKSKVN
ncbi:MAG: MFS transporter [Campylobacteraceae bacterium]